MTTSGMTSPSIYGLISRAKLAEIIADMDDDCRSRWAPGSGRSTVVPNRTPQSSSKAEMEIAIRADERDRWANDFENAASRQKIFKSFASDPKRRAFWDGREDALSAAAHFLRLDRPFIIEVRVETGAELGAIKESS